MKHSKNTKNTEREKAIKELNNIGSWISDKTKKKQVPKDEMMSLSISLMYLKEYLEKNETKKANKKIDKNKTYLVYWKKNPLYRDCTISDIQKKYKNKDKNILKINGTYKTKVKPVSSGSLSLVHCIYNTNPLEGFAFNTKDLTELRKKEREERDEQKRNVR